MQLKPKKWIKCKVEYLISANESKTSRGKSDCILG